MPLNKTILTVDDSASVRKVVSFTLHMAGYEVLEAQNGEDALRRLNGGGGLPGKPVNLVITDLNMPKMDGLGLIKALRAHPKHKYLPIIMLTTESDIAKKQAGRAAGATAWIVKPFRPEQLLEVVQRVVA